MSLLAPLILGAGLLLLALLYRVFTRRVIEARAEILWPKCPECEYDLRVPTVTCPECGAGVPENLQLRAQLMADQLPAWMADETAALPVREPEEAEAWRPLGALTNLRQVRVLQFLLDRAGIAQRSRLNLVPGRSDFLGIPRDTEPLAGATEVPLADWPLAQELVMYVAWRSEAGLLEELDGMLGLDEAAEGRRPGDASV